MTTTEAVDLRIKPLALCKEADFVAARQRNYPHLVAAGEEAAGVTVRDIQMSYRGSCLASQLGAAIHFGLLTADEMIGAAGVRFNQSRTLGEGYCWVDERYEGRSVAYVAMRKIIDAAFTRPDLAQINFGILPVNIRSQRLVQRLGATRNDSVVHRTHTDFQRWELPRG